MKKIYALLITMILLFAACQPTPETEVVQNKNDGKLEAAIQATATPAIETDEDIQEKPTHQPKPHISDSVSNKAGTVTINIDADVTLPGEGTITIARLERLGADYFTQEYSTKIIETFFATDMASLTFYDPYVITKADYEDTILMLQKRMTDEEEMLNCDYAVNEGVTDLDVIKTHINDRIEEVRINWNKAPEDPPIIAAFDGSGCYGTGASFNALIDFGADYRGSVNISDSTTRSSPGIGMSAFGGDYPQEGRCFDFEDMQIDVDCEDPNFLAARQAAESFVKQIGMEGIAVGDVYLVPDRIYGSNNDPLTGKQEKMQISDREFYVFCFERIVGDRTIDFTFYRGAHTGDDEVRRTLPYEQIKVWAEGSRIVSFSWSGVHTVREVLNKNAAATVSYEQALDTAYQQIYSDYTTTLDHGYAQQIIAEISSVEFEMVRMKEKDSKYYISVPAWKIYGGIYEVLSEETIAERTQRLREMEGSREYAIHLPDDFVYPKRNLMTWWNGPNIYTINALDGSVIDMEKGY